ncbi:Set1C complex WD repeat protein Swd3 [Schizosaccharomyces pombe]|uniref:Set1 complex component swd3 n=1 Tax=Schizosaccharomyces pombe (strain 972 / ATCC 24843) TaxID=284812 RepID=SWD3_SCHPO|nr:WD repeat protein Swd3 [Schizosaccharomyces pombe]O43017.1 RecName: Full=Set1 complex component swd3; Short=Set1C component swd3; AltName: Full=COMPASS component swd3; AltName: Full=Complex proteins associated with set1 protein swd3 [Schizosaccharomyces pombe 972h-]CAA17803.1 WD repeat protein Swd3 [Schizosaccharomyces pombe]|eukprot:NP_595227.1 WD repeat protein Swd3 [Schizosaccharomyces pombe]
MDSTAQQFPLNHDLQVQKDQKGVVEEDEEQIHKRIRNYESHSGFSEYCTLFGHEKSVTCVSVSPNKRWIATSSSDGTIKIWSALTFRLECTLFGHYRGISQVKWATGSKYLASASDDKTIRIWDFEKRCSVRCLKGHTNYVSSIDFNPLGTLLVSGSWDETVRIWNLQDGTCLRMLPAHSEPIISVSISADGTLCATASYDGMARIWDVLSGQCLKTLVEPINVPLSNLQFTENRKYLLVSNLNSQIRLWDYRRNRVVRIFDSHVNTRYSMSWDCYSSKNIPKNTEALPNNDSSYPDDAESFMHDAYLLIPSEDGTIQITDPSTKIIIDDSIRHSDDPETSLLNVTSLGPFIITSGTDPYVRVWAPSLLLSKHEKDGFSP